MNKNMEKLILLFLINIFSIPGIAHQLVETKVISNDTIKMDYPCENFLGIWIAKISTNDSIEIKFEKRIIYSTIAKKHCECIMGSVKRIQNGNIILNEPIEDSIQEKNETLLQGTVRQKDLLYLIYGEKGKNKDIGGVDFILQTDKKTATWTLISIRECFLGEQYDPFLLPAKMTFVKKYSDGNEY